MQSDRYFESASGEPNELRETSSVSAVGQAHGSSLVGHDLYRAIIKETDQIKILFVGDFETAESMPLSPRLNDWDTLGLTGPGRKDFYRDSRFQEAFDHGQHFRNRFAKRVG